MIFLVVRSTHPGSVFVAISAALSNSKFSSYERFKVSRLSRYSFSSHSSVGIGIRWTNTSSTVTYSGFEVKLVQGIYMLMFPITPDFIAKGNPNFRRISSFTLMFLS
jgi:hypothetical protein